MPYFSRNVMDPFEARGFSIDYGEQDVRLNVKSLTPITPCGPKPKSSGPKKSNTARAGAEISTRSNLFGDRQTAKRPANRNSSIVTRNNRITRSSDGSEFKL